jgi:hypothetical protein
VYTGLIVSVVGILAGGYAYTGDRVYHIEYLALALFGFALLVVGGLLAGYGQANRPRLGQQSKEPLLQGFGKFFTSLPFVEHDEDEEEDATNDDPTDGTESTADADEGEGSDAAIEATLACPSCDIHFTRTGVVPFGAHCPECGHEATIDEQLQG